MIAPLGCGRSSGVEHNLAKVGVEGSNPFARSIENPLGKPLGVGQFFAAFVVARTAGAAARPVAKQRRRLSPFSKELARLSRPTIL